MSSENSLRLIGAALDLPGAPLRILLDEHFDMTRADCPKCGLRGYEADIRQMGACHSCAEKILGEPIMVLREWAHMLPLEPDEVPDVEAPGQRKGLET